jgi:hypothetical protein
MKIVKFVMGGAGILATALSFGYGVHRAGSHGTVVLVGALIPVALVAFGTLMRSTLPRWGAIVSAIAFLIVAMKTRQGEDLKNIMMAAALGLVLAIVLAIRPERDSTTP